MYAFGERCHSDWVTPQLSESWIKQIAGEFKIDPIVARCLAGRQLISLEQVHHYLYDRLPDLHSPCLFKEMTQAVDRILKAVETQETVLICGDSDVDGMTSTALISEFLRLIGIKKIVYYLPKRLFAVSKMLDNLVSYATNTKSSLVITVDCGTNAVEEVEALAKQKIDVIISDHHEPASGEDQLPKAVAVLNPKIAHLGYPDREITGVGVAFKLVHGVTNALTGSGHGIASKIQLKSFLDLVALGTIADMGKLQGENRIFVRYGLNQFAVTKRQGLLALLKACKLSPDKVEINDISAKVAPVLNSLGRIDDPRKGIELLLLDQPEQAQVLAKEVIANNLKRQQIERGQDQEIEDYFRVHKGELNCPAIVFASHRGHPGVVSIIASRLSKQVHCPAVVFAIEKGVGKGSVRTVEEIPVLPCLQQLAHMILSFGGHQYAAGLIIQEKNIPAFKKAFIELVGKQVGAHKLPHTFYLDGTIQFSDLSFDLLETLDLLKPYGHGNSPPLFISEVNQQWRPKVLGQQHLKFYCEQEGRFLEGIGFGMGGRRGELLTLTENVKIIFTPQINQFMGKSSIQLIIKDFKRATS